MLGEKIKELRISHNLSQVELGKRLGISKQTVSNLENDNTVPSVDLLVNICRFFHCTTDYILSFDKEIEENDFYIELTDLNLMQIAHVQHIVSDFQALNRKIAALEEDAKNDHKKKGRGNQ